ncbi:hypothetical protein [Nonomuraea sp. NPDC003754]
MAEPVRARRLSDHEGQTLQRLVRRGRHDSVRVRRALMVMASAGGTPVTAIAQLVAADARETLGRSRCPASRSTGGNTPITTFAAPEKRLTTESRAPAGQYCRSSSSRLRQSENARRLRQGSSESAAVGDGRRRPDQIKVSSRPAATAPVQARRRQVAQRDDPQMEGQRLQRVARESA